jgi:thiol-disulfide isomerase/thioredoxin
VHRLLAGCLALIVVGCGAGESADDAAPTTAAEAGAVAEVGERAPEATFLRFDGSRASLADYWGRPLVVNFWASWCPPCITEMPAFEAVHQRLGDEVAFLGLDVQDTVEDGQDFLEQVDITWDLGRDPEGTLVQRLGGIGMPTTVLIDADGIVRAIHTGELTEDELQTMIDDELR